MMHKADFMGKNKEMRIKDLVGLPVNNTTDAFIHTLLKR